MNSNPDIELQSQNMDPNLNGFSVLNPENSSLQPIPPPPSSSKTKKVAFSNFAHLHQFDKDSENQSPVITTAVIKLPDEIDQIDPKQGEQESMLENIDLNEQSNDDARRYPPKMIKKISFEQFKWLAALARPQWLLISAGCFSAVFGTGVLLYIPSQIGGLVDTLMEQATQSTASGRKFLLGLAITLAVIMALQAVITFVRAFCFHLAGERIVAGLRRDLFSAIISQEIAFFDSNRVGELVSRLNSDTKALETSLTVNISMALRFSLQAVGGVFVLFFISWKLSLLMLAVVPVLVIGAVLYGKFVKTLSKKVQDALAGASSVAEESIGNVRTVRAFNMEQYQINSYGERIQETYNLGKKTALMSGLFQATMTLAAFVAVGGIVFYGATLVLEKKISIGVLTSFLLYTLNVAVALGGLSILWFDLAKAVGATERVHQIVKRVSEIPNHGGRTIQDHVFEGRIQFENVNFSYPSRPDHPVLRNMNLNLSPGQTVALVGQSGGGKSTVAALIQRLYDPISGTVSLDGIPLCSIDPHWMRTKLSIVSQEPVLFATTIKENIGYGREGATEEEIIQAAREANAYQFVKDFPDGFETLTGERGIRLSGGQKQRIAIARALLRNPRILVLDESTSALDSESESIVQQALTALMKGRTCLIIAHRLSTVVNADVVMVVEKGEVVEQGSHKELLVKSETYRKLVEKQLISLE